VEINIQAVSPEFIDGIFSLVLRKLKKAPEGLRTSESFLAGQYSAFVKSISSHSVEASPIRVIFDHEGPSKSTHPSCRPPSESPPGCPLRTRGHNRHLKVRHPRVLLAGIQELRIFHIPGCPLRAPSLPWKRRRAGAFIPAH
jgi:hypothetical protein